MLHWRQSDRCSLAYKNVWLCMMLDTFAVRQTTQLGLPKWSAAFPSINNSRVATSLPRMLLWWNIHSAAEWWVRPLSHYNNITWASWHLKSTATLFHVKQLLQAQTTDETSEPRITGSLWGNPRGNPTVTGGFFSRRMMTSSNGKKNAALLTFCAGSSPVNVGFAAQRPVTWSLDVFFDLRLNKQLSKQSRRRWIETPWRSSL